MFNALIAIGITLLLWWIVVGITGTPQIDPRYQYAGLLELIFKAHDVEGLAGLILTIIGVVGKFSK